MSLPKIYEQRILSGRLFRLLFIHPAQDQDQQLRCSCLLFDIDSAPPFEALSYAWGPPKPVVDLQCNGLPSTVRSELANALVRMRLQNSTRIMWADAICINQDDVEERNHQVPLMGSIYSSAKRVIVWLGLPDPISDYIHETFQVLELISTTCQQSLDDQGDEPQDRWKSVQIPAHVFTPTACSGLMKLFERPWFSRIWCLQEIRLAADALVRCGDHEIHWHDLGTAASWMFDQSLQFVSGLSDGDFVGDLLNSIDPTRADHMYDHLLGDFLETLGNSRKFQSTDPKDKVYAILNLVAPRSDLDGFEVRYDKSVGEVFANTAMFIMIKTSRLDCLAHVSHPPDYDRNPEYRSWAPRWDHEKCTAAIGGLVDCPWSVCAGMSIIGTHENGLKAEELVLQGIYYGTVLAAKVWDLNTSNVESAQSKNITENEGSLQGSHHSWLGGSNTAVAASSFQPETTLSLLALYQTICSEPYLSPPSANPHLQTQARIRLLARTVVAGHLGLEFIDNLEESSQEQFYLSFRHLLQQPSGSNQAGAEVEHPLSPVKTALEKHMWRFRYERRVFWTSNGSLGLGPQCMRGGDIVVGLYGGSTPYVLRPRGDKYLFMGEAYVDDIMHGELMQAFCEGKVHEETFHLI